MGAWRTPETHGTAEPQDLYSVFVQTAETNGTFCLKPFFLRDIERRFSLCAALRGKNSGTTPCHITRQSEFDDSYLSMETVLAFSIRAPAAGRQWLRSPLAPRQSGTQSNWMPFGRKR